MKNIFNYIIKKIKNRKKQKWIKKNYKNWKKKLATIEAPPPPNIMELNKEEKKLPQ